jgi:hypothetical protein
MVKLCLEHERRRAESSDAVAEATLRETDAYRLCRDCKWCNVRKKTCIRTTEFTGLPKDEPCVSERWEEKYYVWSNWCGKDGIYWKRRSVRMDILRDNLCIEEDA